MSGGSSSRVDELPTVICACVRGETLAVIRDTLKGTASIRVSETPAIEPEILRRAACVVWGDAAPTSVIVPAVLAAIDNSGGAAPPLVVSVGTSERHLIQTAVDRGVYYVTGTPSDPRHVADLTASALGWSARREIARGENCSLAEEHVIRDVARRCWSEREPAACLVHAARAVQVLVRADRGRAVLYDADHDTFGAGTPSDDDSACSGLIAFALRTKSCVSVPVISADPRHDRSADDPDGDGSERLLAVPLLGVGGPAAGALVAVRSRRRPPFSQVEEGVLARLAFFLSPCLQRRPRQAQLQPERFASFRSAALEAYLADALPANVRLAELPRTASIGFWLAVAAGCCAAAYLSRAASW